MTEIEDILLSGEFAAYREAYGPAVRPAGPDDVRLTVRRRRRRALVAVAAVVALAVALPVAANAALGGRSDTPPAPARSVEPIPTRETSPTPSAAPSPTPGTASPTAAPNGGISRRQLFAARVDLPTWLTGVEDVCTGQVRLQAGPLDSSLPSVLGDLGYGDLDGDGATETVALVACRTGEAQAKQLVAFDRDAAGRIVTIGRVVGTQQGMEDITGFSVTSDGKVRAQVADTQPCCGSPGWSAQQQSRTYAWTGDAFTQTAGPMSFGTDPRLTDLTLKAGDLVLGPPDASGKRTGSVTVTVTNKGPVDVPGLGFSNLFTVGAPAGGDLSRCGTGSMQGENVCVLDGLRVGRSRTYTFRFRVDPAASGDRPSLRVVHFDGQGRYWGDLHPEDDTVNLRVVG
ncbi:hypothetical protein [Micromonospora sp. NPDC003776]